MMILKVFTTTPIIMMVLIETQCATGVTRAEVVVGTEVTMEVTEMEVTVIGTKGVVPAIIL